LKRIVIFGNSGSGKSTLARKLKDAENLAHLDLDTVAWLPVSPPTRTPANESKAVIDDFMETNKCWVIEGCYSDLLDLAIPEATEIIYMNLPVEACIANAKKRPWEPHKYESRDAQDANLEMLIDWIAQYAERQDSFSKTAHKTLFDQYGGKKTMHRQNLP
jgi:adenylate kinase family enzyme